MPNQKYNFGASWLRSIDIRYDTKKYHRKKSDKKRGQKHFQRIDWNNLTKIQLLIISMICMAFGSVGDYYLESHPLNAYQIHSSEFYESHLYPVFTPNRQPIFKMIKYTTTIPVDYPSPHDSKSIHHINDLQSYSRSAYTSQYVEIEQTPEIPAMFQFEEEIEEQNVDYVGSNFIFRQHYTIEHVEFVKIENTNTTKDVYGLLIAFLTLLICMALSIIGCKYLPNQCIRVRPGYCIVMVTLIYILLNCCNETGYK